MTTLASVPEISIPSATEDPAKYVQALLDVAEGHDTVGTLATTPVRALTLCAGLTPELAEREPEPGEWSAAQIIGHLFDVDIVYGFRWRLVLTETDPVYPGYDEARWTGLARLPFRQSLGAWTDLRAANTALLRSLTAEDQDRTGRHGEQGQERLDVMNRKVVGHDLAHLNQLYRAVRAARLAESLDVEALDAAYRSFGLHS
jgi:hypothetical protein